MASKTAKVLVQTPDKLLYVFNSDDNRLLRRPDVFKNLGPVTLMPETPTSELRKFKHDGKLYAYNTGNGWAFQLAHHDALKYSQGIEP